MPHSNDRFSTKRKIEKILGILSSIEKRVQFTAEYEDENKKLDYIGTSVINNGSARYEFKVHRKDAITNI